MSELINIIKSADADIRNRSLDAYCRNASLSDLTDACRQLDEFRRNSENLYEQVRALFFLYAIHRFHVPFKSGIGKSGTIPYEGYDHLLKRRFEESIDLFLQMQTVQGGNVSISSALAEAYKKLAFQTLANQVKRSVRSTQGNQWMFRVGHPDDHPLKIRTELLQKDVENGMFPVLHESTPVRMDMSHSGWSDIFFLGMDYPEGANVLNISINLRVRDKHKKGQPAPPIETFFRIIDEPVLRLTSVDLGTTADISRLSDVFDFAKDYLGLLKAAIIAAGIVPPGIEGADQPMSQLLGKIVKPGYGIEIISQVNGIPKGSRLAVSTNLLASLIAVCMRATGQTKSLTGKLQEDERRLVAARAILGEWLGGSGGGWQDSGGIWPGIKLIQGVNASEGDPEFGISRGRLLPRHAILKKADVSEKTRNKLQESLVLVHGGMAQDVGPILEMVTEKYLLRSETEWQARQQAIGIFNELVGQLQDGDIKSIGKLTHANFDGPIQYIIPWASNLYTETIIRKVSEKFKKDFWGFWMLGGMSGGGMGFIFHPDKKAKAQDKLQEIMSEAKSQFEHAIPFAMEPVVYDFSINEKGTIATLSAGEKALLPTGYYAIRVPLILKQEMQKIPITQRVELERLGEACRASSQYSGFVSTLFDRIIPQGNQEVKKAQSLEQLLEKHGFDPVLHQQIKSDLKSGRIGLAQNRLPVSTKIEDVRPEEIMDASDGLDKKYYQLGIKALKHGELAIISLAGGAGSRWTKGAGVVKSLNPYARIAGKHRNFVETHLAKSRKISSLCGRHLTHIFTTSYLTHEAIQEYLKSHKNFGYEGPLYLSPGRIIGLRMIPTARDLRFEWEEMPQQLLDEQSQKMQESVRAALLGWAQSMGEGEDYTDNLPQQCVHPVGHWYEVPNMILNGILKKLMDENPVIQHLMVHNIDTLGANADPAIFGYHMSSGNALNTEVITRKLEDRGGGLAKIDGRIRLIEGLALPDEQIEFRLSYYNSSTTWVNIDKLLETFGLSRNDLDNQEKVKDAVRNMARRMPTYITIKDVKKRWGKGQEDIFPVTQFEKLWGDMTAVPELQSGFIVVPRLRGQQLKEVDQLDGWLRDGSADYLESLCAWE